MDKKQIINTDEFVSIINCKYIIPLSVIKDTERILRNYGENIPSCEGIVYWAGTKLRTEIIIELTIAPSADSFPQRVSVSNDTNAEFVKILHTHKKSYLAQVHSHPKDWVGHSRGDDEWAAFKHNGLLSVVVPNYSTDGMLPLIKCGFHKYYNGKFFEMNEQYSQNNILISNNLNSTFIDLR